VPRTGPYAVELVATAATGIDLNASGDVVGSAYVDTGCGSFCLPPRETVVWRNGTRIPLPALPGWSGITVRALDDAGVAVGFAGVPGTATRAVVWRPVGGAYEIVDLGTLPGTTSSEAVGIDEQGRVVGWSTTLSFPPNGSPFLWSEATGMIDLSQLGFPDEQPVAISPGGTVATAGSWYRLDVPGSAVALAPPPSGYLVGASPAAINDAGDQARFLVRATGQTLVYPFRYHRSGVWQQISTSPTGNLSRYGIGSIDDEGTITATVTSTGVIAPGPAGLAQPLSTFLAAPYVYPDLAATAVVGAGPRNARGEILASVLLGRSARLVRLVPQPGCLTGCMRVEGLSMDAVFVDDPGDPGHCAPDLSAHDEVQVSLTVRGPSGSPLPGVLVLGRFLDDYWTSHAVSGTTDGNGLLTFSYVGPCGVGAIEFLVEDARRDGLELDRLAGTLSVWEIPQ